METPCICVHIFVPWRRYSQFLRNWIDKIYFDLLYFTLPTELYNYIENCVPERKYFSQMRQQLSGPRFYVLSERQGWYTKQTIWKQSHINLPIPDSNVQPFSHKSNALLTELRGVPNCVLMQRLHKGVDHNDCNHIIISFDMISTAVGLQDLIW